ncbi:MAG: hypothetical protein Q8Q09_03530 [Deltaproteobacteria bacterium]|nr:hypothetical protein [Deltaproteobacteria bacterium]
MKKSIVLAVGMMIMALVGGCGGGGPAGSCSTGAAGSMSCTDYGTGFNAADTMRACSAGTYSAGTCTATGRVGRCVINATSGGATASSTVNFYDPITVEIAMMACTASGSGAGVTATFMAN